jgi:hypothetical protein
MSALQGEKEEHDSLTRLLPAQEVDEDQQGAEEDHQGAKEDHQGAKEDLE